MDEIWKDISGYEGLYQISNKGRVKSLDRIMQKPKLYTVRGKILKQGYTGHYLFVNLAKEGKYENKYIHRMVAEAFIPNDDGKTQVKHIDENTKNNCVENLEWCTAKHNANHGSRNKKISEALKNKITTQSVLYEYKGITKTLKQWADYYGMPYQLFYSRWRKGKRADQLFDGYVKEEGVMNE
jgi:hypothetical protein